VLHPPPTIPATTLFPSVLHPPLMYFADSHGAQYFYVNKWSCKQLDNNVHELTN